MSLQTLHPTSFDEGIILDQTPWPGIVVPDKCDYQTLLEIMQPLGAEMLVKAIRKRLYLPPLHAVGWVGKFDNAKTMYKHAPKIETAHKLLCFERMDSSHILRMSQAFESTWAFAAAAPQRSKIKRQRIIFQGPLSILSTPSTIFEDNMSVPEVPPGLPYWRTDAMNDAKEHTTLPLFVNTIDGKTISADYLKIEGGVKMPAQRAALKHRLTRQQRDLNSKSVITFHEALTSAP
jgi:methionyl-tRNA formyltransferase